MGARPEDYANVAPHNSYIHVDQFKGPEELAEYLHELDKDDVKYNQYFQVRKISNTIRQTSFLNEKTFFCIERISFKIQSGI